MSVTIPELKEHLRITWDDEDTALQPYLQGALSYLESFTGRKLSQASRTSYFDKFCDLELVGDNPTSIVVQYVDADGVTQTLDSSVYALKVHKARPYLTLAYGQSWPSVRAQDAAITVTYQSGYTASTIPGTLRAAVLIEAATQYEYRENESIVNLKERKAVERLATPYRIYTL